MFQYLSFGEHTYDAATGYICTWENCWVKVMCLFGLTRQFLSASQSGYIIYTPTNSFSIVHILIHTCFCQSSSLQLFGFHYRVQWHLTVVSFCISMVINESECLSYTSTICSLSFMKYLFKSLAHSPIGFSPFFLRIWWASL